MRQRDLRLTSSKLRVALGAVNRAYCSFLVRPVGYGTRLWIGPVLRTMSRWSGSP